MPTQAIDWKSELLAQLDFHWDHHFVPRIQGMTDAEYLWEPVANCWTVHPNDDGSFSVDLQAWPEPDPVPFTTIAWRMTHLMKVFGERASRQFGDASYSPTSMYVPGSADGAIAELTRQHDLWRSGLESLSEDDLGRPTGPTEGPYYKDAPLVVLILHIHREYIHHASEVCLLRDLYRNRETLGIWAPDRLSL
jgi:hypothetical protein